MKARKILVLGVLLTAAVLAAAVWVWQCQRQRTFAELIPFPAESVVRWELVPTEAPGADYGDLTGEQAAGLLDALEQGTYQYDGSSTALQGCYARLFLWTSERDHIELMLSEERILVNTDFKGRGSPTYAITDGNDAVTGYIKDFIKAVYGMDT